MGKRRTLSSSAEKEEEEEKAAEEEEKAAGLLALHGTSSAGAGAGTGAVAGAEAGAGEAAGSSVSDNVGRTTGLASFFFCPLAFGIVEYGSLLKTIKNIYMKLNLFSYNYSQKNVN